MAEEEEQLSGHRGQLSKTTARVTFFLEGLHRPSTTEQSEQAPPRSQEAEKPVAGHSQVSESQPRSLRIWRQSSSYLKLSLWDTRMDLCLTLSLLA